MAWVYGFLAAAAAVGCEVWYRASPDKSYAWLFLHGGVLLAVLVNYAIWGVLRTETLLGVAVVFSLWTAAMRLGWTLHVGEHVASSTYLAFGLLVLAGLVKLARFPS